MAPTLYKPQVRDVRVYQRLLDGGLRAPQLGWVPLGRAGSAGITVEWLYTAGETADGAEAYIARYAPGAHDEAHEHLGHELTFVLDGELRDGNGEVYQPGTLVTAVPGSVHQLTSPAGCTALIVREKGLAARPAIARRYPGVRCCLLSPDSPGSGLAFEEYVQPGREAVAAHWLYTGEQTGPEGAEAYVARFGPGAHGDLHRHLGFEMLLILGGELRNDNGQVYGPGSLVIERPGSVHQVRSEAGCVMLVVREKRTVALAPGEAPEDSPFPMAGRPADSAPALLPLAQDAAAAGQAPAALALTGRNGKAHSPRYMWGILAIGIGAQAAFSAVFQGIPAAGSQLQAAYGYSDPQLGMVLSAAILGIFLTDVLWGIAADRFGERLVLITGLTGTTLCLGAAAMLLTPAAGHPVPPAALSAVLLLAGALGGCVNGASGRAIMGWFPASRRGFAISLRVAAVPLGGAIGAGVLPWLAGLGGFRWAFGFLAAAALAATIAVALWLDEPPLARSGDSSAPAAISPLRRPDIWRVASTAFLLDLPQFTVLTFGSVFLHEVEHIPLPAIAVLLVLTQACGGLSRVIGGRWTDQRGGRYRRTIVTVYSSVITAGFLGIAAFESAPSWVVAALMVVSGTLAFGWHGVHYAEVATMAGAQRSGTALGLENTMVFGGAFITPLIIPWLLHLSSWPTVMVVTGAVPALLSALIMPREPRRAGGRRRPCES